MNGFWEGLQKPEYIHVLINHLPITGLGVAVLFLLVSLVARNRGGILSSLLLIGLLALSAWPVYHYGEAAYDRVLSMTYSEGGAWLKHHRDLAETWIYLYFTTAVVSLVAFVIGWFSPKSLKWGVPLVLVLTMGSLLVGSFVADAGGKVRHEEFRFGPPPTEEEQGEEAEPTDEEERSSSEQPTSSEQRETPPSEGGSGTE